MLLALCFQNKKKEKTALAAVRAENKAALAPGRELHRIRPGEKARPM